MQPDGCAARAPKGERREATQAMSTAERRAKASAWSVFFFLRTEANRRLSPRKVTALKRHPNTKHPTAKRAACSSGRTVSDEIQQLQTTTRHLISPREIQSDESRIPQCSISSYGRETAEIPHQKPADQKTAGKVQLGLRFHFRTSA